MADISNRTPGPWFVGSQNDALFIINKPPRPSNDDINPNVDADVIAKVYDDADGAFIARAGNCWDDLVAALDGAPVISKYHGHNGFDAECFIVDYETWRVTARAVLGRARGEG